MSSLVHVKFAQIQLLCAMLLTNVTFSVVEMPLF